MKFNKKTKEIVENLLRDDPRCRSDDTWLFICVLRKFGVKLWIDYQKLGKIPALETVTKYRRVIQNEDNKYNAEKFIPEQGMVYEKPTSKC